MDRRIEKIKKEFLADECNWLDAIQALKDIGLMERNALIDFV